ncbi:MAG: HypC/HybG/HupF family hydrogenase formation chaperone [Candidatus Dormibacteraeota bacterium]|nr:HypC/HybG/HupF family hydrogenase formation chaperone [Candidatus Dormibacteraeota bacterium]
MTEQNPMSNGGFAGGDPPHVCITCSDQLLRMVVERVDESGMIASGSIEGEPAEIGVDLIDGVAPGDILLCHGGVALQRVSEATGIELGL